MSEYIQHLYSSSLAFDLLNALQYHDTKCKILLFHIFRAISIISSLCLLVDDSVMVVFSADCFSHWLLDLTTMDNWQNKPRSSWEENISDKSALICRIGAGQGSGGVYSQQSGQSAGRWNPLCSSPGFRMDRW